MLGSVMGGRGGAVGPCSSITTSKTLCTVVLLVASDST